MNTADVLYYGHRTFLASLDGLAQTTWQTPDVCGVWSVRDIVAHLASFELVLVDVLQAVLGHHDTTPLLGRFIQNPMLFNDEEVAARQQASAAAVLEEYQAAYAQAAELIRQVPVAQCRQNGILPWYGPTYDLDDFLAYTYYGHKREHAAQINIFRDQLRQRH